MVAVASAEAASEMVEVASGAAGLVVVPQAVAVHQEVGKNETITLPTM